MVTVELWHHSLHDVLKYAGGKKWNQEKNRSVSTFSGGLDSKVDPTRIHADLTDVYREHSVLYWTVCRWIIQRLEVGKWTEVECRPCCLILAWKEQTFPWVKQVMTEFPHVSVSAVGSRSDLFRRTVEKILHDDLHLQKKICKVDTRSTGACETESSVTEGTTQDEQAFWLKVIMRSLVFWALSATKDYVGADHG